MTALNEKEKDARIAELEAQVLDYKNGADVEAHEADRLRAELSALKLGPDDEAVREAMAAVDKYGERQYPTGEDRAALCESAKILSASCRKAWAELEKFREFNNYEVTFARAEQAEARVLEFERMAGDCDCGPACEKAKGTAHRAIRMMREAEGELGQARDQSASNFARAQKAERELAEARKEADRWRREADIDAQSFKESQSEVERLRAALERIGTHGCGCRPVCVCFSEEGLKIWREVVLEVVKEALSPKPCAQCNGERPGTCPNPEHRFPTLGKPYDVDREVSELKAMIAAMPDEPKPCAECAGTGQRPRIDGPFMGPTVVPCTTCQPTKACVECGGTGKCIGLAGTIEEYVYDCLKCQPPKPCQYCNGVRWIERKPNGPRPCSCNPGARIPYPPKPDEGKPVVHRQTCATERQDRSAHECDCGADEGKR